MFSIKKDCIIDDEGVLTYSKNTHEFISYPIINSDIVISIIYINIGFDSYTRTSTQVWGFHPNFNWIKKFLNPPKAIKGKIIILETEIEPGLSERIDKENHWTTFYDKTNGWIKLSDNVQLYEIKYVEIFANTIVGINNDGNIIELWLNPEIV